MTTGHAFNDAWDDAVARGQIVGESPFAGKPSMADACCEHHNRHCEPPSELCCAKCPEIHHGWHICTPASGRRGQAAKASHHDGSTCVLESE